MAILDERYRQPKTRGPWTPSWECEELIMASEGYRPRAYPDTKGVFTCGWGHTANVTQDTTCDEDLARRWLQQDMDIAFDSIRRTVHVALSQGMVDAITDWTFNLGAGEWHQSEALRYLNNGFYEQCIIHMMSYVYAGKHVLPGLRHRREEEALMFRK